MRVSHSRLGSSPTLAMLVVGSGILPAQRRHRRRRCLVRDRVAPIAQAHEPAILEELRQLVALPNVARDAEDIASNAALLRQMLERRGFTTQTLTVPDAPPAVYGSLDVPGATRTVVFYAHYDGQPVTPADWATPAWAPVLRGGTLEAGAAEVPWDALPPRIPR